MHQQNGKTSCYTCLCSYLFVFLQDTDKYLRPFILLKCPLCKVFIGGIIMYVSLPVSQISYPYQPSWSCTHYTCHPFVHLMHLIISLSHLHGIFTFHCYFMLTFHLYFPEFLVTRNVFWLFIITVFLLLITYPSCSSAFHITISWIFKPSKIHIFTSLFHFFLFRFVTLWFPPSSNIYS